MSGNCGNWHVAPGGQCLYHVRPLLMKLTIIAIQGSPGGTISDKKFVKCDDADFYNTAQKGHLQSEN